MWWERARSRRKGGLGKARAILPFFFFCFAQISGVSLAASSAVTTFTYQGCLTANGFAAQGSYDLVFALFDSPTNGVLLAGPLTNSALAVSNGLFTAVLDFGAAFDGGARWVEISVRGGGGPFTALTPRQLITPTPLALFAATAGTASISLSAPTPSSFTNLIFAGRSTNVTTPSHFSPAVSSLTNIVIGSDLGAGLNSHALEIGSSIGIPDTGGIWWADGSSISSRNNAHAENSTGSAMTLINPNCIALLMFGGVNTTPFFQFGYSGPANELFKIQYNDSQYFGSFSPGYLPRSKVMTFVTQSGDASLQGIGGPTNQFTFGELWFWSGDADQRGVGGPYARFNGRMLTNGWDFRGREVNERTVGTAQSLCALDFSLGKCADLTASGSPISFFTTNRAAASTNYEQRVFIIRAGTSNHSLLWPGQWTWLTPAPNSIGATNLLRLSLESIGPGESNILASASSGIDQTVH
jgi:hypothetical protein